MNTTLGKSTKIVYTRITGSFIGPNIEKEIYKLWQLSKD